MSCYPMHGFRPGVPLRRTWFINALTGLNNLANPAKPFAKPAPPGKPAPRPTPLRPTTHRVRSLWVRLATAVLGGIGVALLILAVWGVAGRWLRFRRARVIR